MVQSLQELPRVGHVEDGQPLHHLWVTHHSVPGDGSAPVVPDQQRGLGTTFVDEIADVVGQLVAVVGMDAVRLRGQVVAAHVRGNDPKSRRRKRRDLVGRALICSFDPQLKCGERIGRFRDSDPRPA